MILNQFSLAKTHLWKDEVQVAYKKNADTSDKNWKKINVSVLGDCTCYQKNVLNVI